jgi:4,5-DOPA dioxygenase extradiol
MSAHRTPIYFLSHGGPNTCHDSSHPVYPKLNSIGKEITSQVKPSAIVVFSAHWQSGSGPNTIEVNTASNPLPLIYDFYGFPDHYYKTEFPYRASGEVSQRVVDVLKEGGVKAVGVQRGLDHGVWVPFKVVFEGHEEQMPPIVQVSLFDSEDAGEHLRLGRAVAKLREENILIVVSGMAVHNLGDLRFTMMDPKPLPYTVSFDEALRQAVESEPGSERDRNMKELVERSDARKAHPTFEHLLPIHIGAGAAGSDRGTRLWTMGEGSLSWAQFRLGEIETN